MSYATGNCTPGSTCMPHACRKTVHPGSMPIGGVTITAIDLDLTVDCNLACDYCFKERGTKHMSLETAQDAIVWLILASGESPKITATFIGGEPLLRFGVIRELVPFAKRRAYQHGKEIHFGMTTNGTILTEDILSLWRQWGLGFHTSIDGCPGVQDRHRRFVDGRGTSDVLAGNLPRILSVRPNTTARSTVLPDTVENLAESFEYLLALGYRDIALVPGAFALWDEKSVTEFAEQFRAIMLRVIRIFRDGQFVKLKFFDEGCRQLASTGSRPSVSASCGAGRGMVLIDVNGDIWPCHRWCREDQYEWRLGSIYDGDFNYESKGFIDDLGQKGEEMHYCGACPAHYLCSGGCPPENLEDTGNIWRRHPTACDVMRVTADVVKEFHDTLLAEENPVFMKAYYHNQKPSLASKRDNDSTANHEDNADGHNTASKSV